MARDRSCLVAAVFALIALSGAPLHAEAPLFPVRLAFPSVGTLISGQVGTTLQNTELFKSHGFAARITPMPLGKELKAALVAGQVDVVFTSEANFVVLLGEGFDCYAISSFGSGGNMALVVKPDSPIKKISDLRGKRVATIFGTSIHQPAVEWLKQSGLEPGREVTLMNMRGMGPMNAAFLSGGVDALLTFDPYLLEGLKKGSYRVLRQTDLDLVVVMSAAYAKKNPDSIAAFNGALKAAMFYVASHKEEANRWTSLLSGVPPEILDEGSRANRNYLATSLSQVDLSISPRLKAKLARLGDFLYLEKLIERRVTIVEHIK